MKPIQSVILTSCWFTLMLILRSPMVAQTAEEESPVFTIQKLDNQQIRLAWSNLGANAILESTDSLRDPIFWEPITISPLINGNETSVTLAVGDSVRFFRLRTNEDPVLTQIISTSPVNGETGVAVTRKTVVHFSEPLADGFVLTQNHFNAQFGGRTLSSRIELSSDRTQATLFYLETLPSSARISVVFDGSQVTDHAGLLVDADGDGVPGGQATLTFETLSQSSVPGTAVIGTVFASELVPGPDTGSNAVNKPLAGVTITVDGGDPTMRTVTDAQGNFTLMNCPAGRFFVHIDGRTVTDLASGIRYPDQAYYPLVGKSWDAVAGRVDNLAGGTGEIYLPLISSTTLQPVSATQDTTITFPPEVLDANPALVGVSITVPANSLYGNDGTRGGKVGIAPVPPDRLPGPLPAELNLPLVITVQTDGASNFDQPAPICFPNLPDPLLGVPLPPNSKQYLISFNHDKGVWEGVGSMTVSEDGALICTDPGVGILAPGWHGVAPQPDQPPPCSELCCDDGGPSDPLEPLTKSTPPRRCTSKPCKNKYAACLKKCADELQTCLKYASRAQSACYHEVNVNFKCNERADNDFFCDPHLARCDRAWLALQKQCNSDKFTCDRQCFNDCESGRQLAEKSSLENDLIAQLLDEISALMEPYRQSGTEIPIEVRNQILQLLSEIESATEGDPLTFLREQAIEQEEALSLAEQEFGEDTGNAPPYPILYAAQISRGGSTFTLRGQTQPFGQYSLFTPRDGNLLYVMFYDPLTQRFGITFPRLSPNARYTLRRFNLYPIDETFTDIDQDGLVDLVEFIYGTEDTLPDSDHDGILDGAEIAQGTDPLDGVPVRIGIVGSARTPGSAVDVAAGNNLLAVAQGVAGVSVFNLSNGATPVLITHVPGSGNAQRVALSDDILAVASGDAGVLIYEGISSTENPPIRHFNMPGAQAIAAGGGVVYAGFSSGDVVVLNPETGLRLNQLSVTNSVRDLVLNEDHLYVLTDDLLFAVSIAKGEFTLAGVTNAPASVTFNQRLFAGGGIAYTVHGRGYNTFDLANPSKPILLATGATAQFGWNHVVVNGSGMGIAAIGANPGSPADVALYDVSNPLANNQFLTQFVTPGTARAVSLHNGLAYVADGSSGIQVVNYLAYDNQAMPPSIILQTSASEGSVESLSTLRLTAITADDVQVRHVEFYVNGERAFSDGNFPFEYRFPTPALSDTLSNLTLRARAVDTGGNSTWSDEQVITLLPDTTPPRVLAGTPLGGAEVITHLEAYFSEAMNPDGFSTSSFLLISAGPDGMLDTDDDLPVSGGTVTYHPENPHASIDFISPLPIGLYRAVVNDNLTDLAGNPLTTRYSWQIRVAQAVFWSSATDGFWEDGSNWSTGTVPNPTEVIYIESIPGDITVFHGNSTRILKSLVVNERLVLNGATFQISETIELHQPMILTRSTLNGGTIVQTDTGKLQIAQNTVSTLDGLRIIGDFSITNNVSRVVIRNGLTLSGNVILDNGGGLSFAGDQTFNSGQVIFAGNSGILGIEPGTTLILGPDMVLRGKSGLIGQGVVSGFGLRRLINQGLISADTPGGNFNMGPSELENIGMIETRNGGALTLFASSAVTSQAHNTGQINVHPGSTLTLDGPWKNSGTITQNEGFLNLGGSFRLDDLGTLERSGGEVSLTGTLDLEGNTLNLNAAAGSWVMKRGTLKAGTVLLTENSKLIFPDFNSGTLDGIEFHGDLEIIRPQALAIIRNGLTLEGNVILNNAGAITFAGDQTFNTGQIIFAGTPGNLSIEPGTTLTLGPNMVVRGKSGNIGQGAISFFGLRKLINHGVIQADVEGGLINVFPSELENVGTIEIRNGTSMLINASSAPITGMHNSGQIKVLNGSTFTLNGLWSNTGTIDVSEATLNIGGQFSLSDIGNLNRVGGTVNLNGTLDLQGNTLTLNETTGPWRMENSTLKNGRVIQTGEANLIIAPNSSNVLDALNVVGDLLLTTTGTRAMIRNGLVLEGSVLLDNGGNLTFSGTQTFDTGQVIFGNTNGQLNLDTGTTLTLGPNMVVRGKSGTLRGNSFGTFKVINQGLIWSDTAGGDIQINLNELMNDGILRASDSATLRISNTLFTNNGQIEELNGGQVIINP